MTDQCETQKAVADQDHKSAFAQEQDMHQPRVLSLDEVKAVAGGPYIQNGAE